MKSKSRRTVSDDDMPQLADWRDPLVRIREKLEQMRNQYTEIHHAMIVAPVLQRDELDDSISKLAPLIQEDVIPAALQPFMTVQPRVIVKEIALGTPACGFHGHFFMAKNHRAFEVFSEALEGVCDWLKTIRKSRHICWIDVPGVGHPRDLELVHWTSLVYHYGAVKNTHHLMVNFEFQSNSNYFSVLPWVECPILEKESTEWLTYQCDFEKKTRQIIASYAQRRISAPDVIGMYLEQDLVASSLSAIDLILYRLPTERSRKKASQKVSKEWSLNELRKNSPKTLAGALAVVITLQGLHGMGKEGDPEYELPNEQPLYWSQKQIAILLGWTDAETGSPLAEKVSRRFRIIFGPNPKQKYMNLVDEDDDLDNGYETLRVFLDRRRREIDKVISEKTTHEKRGPIRRGRLK